MTLLIAALAWGAGAQAPGEPVDVWRRLRAEYIEYLSALPEDPVGARAAEFLKRSSVALEATDLQSRLGEGVFAAYEASRRSIHLDRRGLEDVWLSLGSAELQPDRARPFIERTAPAVVHEIRHAMDHEGLGEPPIFLEHEWTAYADQALFLWRRLAEDPRYRELADVERTVSGRTEGPRRGWWKRPLRRRAGGLQRFLAAARRELGARLTSQETNDWFLARSLAGGVKGLRAGLEQAGFLAGDSVLQPPAGAAERARSELEHLWRRLAVLRSTSLPPQEKQRRAGPLEAELESAERLAGFWGDARRRERAAAYLVGQLERAAREWEAMR